MQAYIANLIGFVLCRQLEEGRKANSGSLAGNVSASVCRREAKMRALKPVSTMLSYGKNLIGRKLLRRWPHPSSDDLADSNKRWRPLSVSIDIDVSCYSQCSITKQTQHTKHYDTCRGMDNKWVGV
jgi:hypothetical protein